MGILQGDGVDHRMGEPAARAVLWDERLLGLWELTRLWNLSPVNGINILKKRPQRALLPLLPCKELGRRLLSMNQEAGSH